MPLQLGSLVFKRLECGCTSKGKCLIEEQRVEYGPLAQ